MKRNNTVANQLISRSYKNDEFDWSSMHIFVTVLCACNGIMTNIIKVLRHKVLNIIMI